MKADLNLFDSYRLNNKHVATKSSALYTIIALIIAVTVLIAVTTGVLIAFNLTDAQRINQIKIENMELKRDTARVEMLQEELRKNTQKLTTYEAIDNDIKIARMLTKQEITQIQSSLTAGTVIKSGTYTNGVLVLSCTTDDIHNPANCAEGLNKRGFNAKVDYAGFTARGGTKASEGEGTEADKGVDFTITCHIAAEEEGGAV